MTTATLRSRPDRADGTWNLTVDLGRRYTPERGWYRARVTRQLIGTREEAERALAGLVARATAPVEVPRSRSRARRRSRPVQRAPEGPRWPLEPLLASLGGATIGQAAVRLGIHPRQVYTWRDEGLTDQRADRAAIELGLHPSEVWGRAWWMEDELEL